MTSSYGNSFCINGPLCGESKVSINTVCTCCCDMDGLVTTRCQHTELQCIRTWRLHHMETLSALMALCVGNPRSPLILPFPLSELLALCEEKALVTDGFPSQSTSNADKSCDVFFVVKVTWKSSWMNSPCWMNSPVVADLRHTPCGVMDGVVGVCPLLHTPTMC